MEEKEEKKEKKIIYQPVTYITDTDYEDYIQLDKLDEETIQDLNDLLDEEEEQAVINIPNTKGLSSEMLKKLDDRYAIRVAGGFDEERIKDYEKLKFTNGETGQEYYILSTTYSKKELVSIIEAMEKIEASIDKNWTDLEKVVAIYEKLKGDIFYDPKYEEKASFHTRTLRGLISKQSVCAGYSMIFKELLERQGIPCDYVSGWHYTENSKEPPVGHAWNIVEIDGKKYPFDLTFDASSYRFGTYDDISYLGQNSADFITGHIPKEYEDIQDYIGKLHSLDLRELLAVREHLERDKEFFLTTFYRTREDGSMYFLAQVANLYANGHPYYKYVYADILDDATRLSEPQIFYSRSNLARQRNNHRFNTNITEGFEEAFDNVLFSKENIEATLEKGTTYIGRVVVEYDENDKPVLIEKVDDIVKTEQEEKFFAVATKQFERSDGTKFIVQKFRPAEVEDKQVYRYDFLEIVDDEGIIVVKKNNVWTETDLLNVENEQCVADCFLSREKINSHALLTGGYLGELQENGNTFYDSHLINYFKNFDYNTEALYGLEKLPAINELYNNTCDYALTADPLGYTGVAYDVVDYQTGEVVEDPSKKDEIMFSYLWCYNVNEIEEETKQSLDPVLHFQLYYMFMNEVKRSIENTGNLDTLYVYEKMKKLEHGDELAVRLLGNTIHANFVDKYIRERCSSLWKNTKSPEPIYNITYAENKLDFKEYVKTK